MPTTTLIVDYPVFTNKKNDGCFAIWSIGMPRIAVTLCSVLSLTGTIFLWTMPIAHSQARIDPTCRADECKDERFAGTTCYMGECFDQYIVKTTKLSGGILRVLIKLRTFD